MRRGNAGQIGPYRTLGSSGVLALDELQQSKSGFVNIIKAKLLVVGGGGTTGGPSRAGGGGGGGFLDYAEFYLKKGVTYNAVIGAGGGNFSSFGGIVFALGGGAGGGGAGGCGGGGSEGSKGAGSALIPAQGKNGGTAATYSGAGGGGAGAAGGNAADFDFGGNGGAGLASSITGSAVYYSGGGGGFGSASSGSGGIGGGASPGTAGTANTGGGGSPGGSGVCILSVPTSTYTGITTGSPIITTNGSDTIIKFNSSGSYTP